ncbi:MAG: hypothetical protein HJJLKODD_00851 [Phycisphaerae bacterium]|nr:hypothetical protein [Phycisphaerae bacterium]
MELQAFNIKTKDQVPTAFSLVELVIVIVIIGILAAIAIPRYSSATDSAQLQQARANARTIQKALDLFMAEHSSYPFPGCVDETTCSASLCAELENGLLEPEYLKALPQNPLYPPAVEPGFSVELESCFGPGGYWLAKWNDGDPRIGYCGRDPATGPFGSYEINN